MSQEQKDALQEHLDTIESGILHVSGYLSMLSKLGAIHPRFGEEAESRLNELGEMAKAVLACKRELGLHSELKLL